MKGHFSAARRRRSLVALSVVALGCGVWFATTASAAPKRAAATSQQQAINDLQQAQVVVHTYTKPLAGIARAGSRCWGEIRDRLSLVLKGITLGWVEVDQEGWCGNNKRITWQGGATYPKYHAFPYCWADTTTSDTWLQYPAWRHAQDTRQIGVPTPLGCLGERTLHAHLRYAANGYWDRQY